MLLTFGLALVIEGLMGMIWGNTSHSVRPSYFNESFAIGDAVPAEGAGLRLRSWRSSCSAALYLDPHPHVAGAGDPRERRQPAGRRARRRQRGRPSRR